MKFKVAGASVQGTRHIKYNIPCQDAFAYDVTDEYVIVCVADGLGSARLSHIGSERGVRIATEAIKKQFDTHRDEDKARQAMIEVFREVNHGLRTLASQNKNDVRDYATTLICVLAWSDSVVVGHIGDGAVVISKDNNVSFLSAPQHGEYAGEVTPVTSENFEDVQQISFRSLSPDYIAVFSDGLERLAIDLSEGRPFTPFFDPLFAAIAEAENTTSLSSDLEQFLKSDRVCERTDDDKTLVLVGKIYEETTQQSTSSNAGCDYSSYDHLSDKK
jgi:serine/threonine protein phosphatase PrpC